MPGSHLNRQPASPGSDTNKGARLGLLFTILLLLAAYRMWVIPRLGITLYVDEAQYWTWAKSPDWGYFSKPPVIGWLIAATTWIFGDGLVPVKLPSLILYPATSCLLFLLGRRIYDERTGFRTAIAFSLMPLVSALGLFVSTDAPLLFFWTLAMWFFVRAIDENRWRDWIGLGFAVGLGIMSKYTMAAFGLSALAFLLIDPIRRKQLGNTKLWIAVAIAALIVLPNILWNWSHGFPTLHHTADITHVEGSNEKTGNFGEFVVAQIASVGPGFAIAFLLGIAWAIRNRRLIGHQATLCFSVPLLGIVVLQAIRSEANGNWAAPALIAVLLLAVAWLSRQKLRWWVLALAINMIAMFAVYHLTDIARLTHTPITARIDPLKRAKGWSQLAAELRPILAAHPNALLLADHRTLMAHMLYELRDLHLDAVAWAPQDRPQDHYQLTIPLRDEEQSTRPLILITQSDPYGIARRFMSASELAHLSVDIEPGLHREASVMLLSGFKGYK